MADNYSPEDSNQVEAARSEAAHDRAIEASVVHEAADEEAIRARVRAQQAQARESVAAAEHNVAGQEVALERRRASNYTFGFFLTLGVLCAALFVGALYLLTGPRDRDQYVVNAGTLPQASPNVVITPGAPAVVTSPGAPVVTARPPGTPLHRIVVTSRAPYATVFTSDPAPLAGQRVTFDIVNVDSVIADRAFWVGPSDGGRMLAVLDPGLDEGVMEKLVQVKKGQTRTMSGTIQQVPPMDQARIGWKLDDGDVYDIQDQTYYVLVDRIDLR